MSENRLISTLAMMRDPRLRRLFALVGLCLEEEALMNHEDALYGILLDLAPEYLPPEDNESAEFREEWREMVDLALGRTTETSL